jgi:hypothetical protein
MKSTRLFAIAGILFLSILIVTSACKKKEETPEPSAPTFLMSSIADSLDATKVFFYFKCTTDDVTLTKLIVTDPLGLISDTYDMTGNTYLKDQVWYLTTPYTKETGTWKFQFTGNRTSDHSGFVSTATLNLSK